MSSGTASLFHNDLDLALPVLGRIEQQGAWITKAGRNSAAAVMRRLERRLGGLERQFMPYLKAVDPYRAKPDELVDVLSKVGHRVDSARWKPWLTAKEELARLALAHPRVNAILQARSIQPLLRWVDAIAKNNRITGMLVPQATGRFGYRALHLNGIPKHIPEAQLIRALLGPPPGYCLVGADFSSFELRLIAGLSQDPILLDAAKQPDAFMALARSFFGVDADQADRRSMKRFLHALNYGQDMARFVGAQPELTIVDATRKHETLCRSFPTLFAWKDEQTKVAQADGLVRTAGGWTRRIDWITNSRKRRNIVCSTLVQGLAADIFRWCLRRLDSRLRKFGAFIVLENHDEVYVATPPEHREAIKLLIRQVFEVEVAERTKLVPQGVTLTCKVKEGDTWADLS
jgi:DNA polymerase-1